MRTRNLTTRLARAVLLLGLMSVGITAARTAQAGFQLFTAEWYVNTHGNECGGMGTTGPHCTKSTGSFYYYLGIALPQGIQCNSNHPQCAYSSTPTNGTGVFSRLGGGPSWSTGLYCAPYTIFNSGPRPAKGQTPTSGPPPTGNGRAIPPLYRNPNFFTPMGQPNTTFCNSISTGFTTQMKTRFGKNKGKVMQGNPIEGIWGAVTTSTTPLGGFSFVAAPADNNKAGIRTTGQKGQLPQWYPYPYHYTYATLRNDQGFFGPGQGPGSFNIVYPPQTTMAPAPVATINVKQGAAKFGGTMQMLGDFTMKICQNIFGGCSLGTNRWRYDAIGAATPMRTAYPSGVITGGAIFTYYAYYYHSALMFGSTVTLSGSRFPWTTGSVTVAATGRGPWDTVHYAHGYDNRNTTTMNPGTGTIQLVSPVLTRWLGTKDFETGGIAILKIQFIAAATDSDSDGVEDTLDNCSATGNTAQNDSDGDDCGNLCDADYDQNGIVGWSDFGFFTQCFNTATELCQHGEPIGGGMIVDLSDFGELAAAFELAPGPSGPTAGTTACP